MGVVSEVEGESPFLPSLPSSLILPCLLYRDRRGGGRRPVRSYNDLDMPDDMY